jgi:tetratricopeptide (TPR) repeat protein
VLLDNAASSEQVRPLLPASLGCLAVVTSRDRLTALVAAEGAHPLALGLLTRVEARQLLARRLGRARVADEPQAVDEIVTRCARLPLALTVVAARAATRPTFPLAVLADELREARSGLDAFAGGDAGTDVRAVFSWSYHTLSASAARLFRLLGLHVGPGVRTAAAASLAGVSVREAGAALAELARANLVDEHAPGRWAYHDLLRAYAAELTRELDSEEQRRMALRRLLDHYLQTAHTAALLMNPHRDPIELVPAEPGVVPASLADSAQAVAWFTAEHAALLAALDQAAEPGFDVHAWQLVWTLWDFFDRRGHWHDWAVAHRAALAAAERLGDARAQAFAHRGLGRAYARLGRGDDAQRHYQRALELFTELGDLTGQARSHLSLAGIFEGKGSPRDGLRHSEQALELFRSAGNRAGQARALNAVGWHHAQLGDYADTLEFCRQAFDLQCELSDRRGKAATLDSIGYAHHHMGQYAEAIGPYQRSLELLHELGDRAVEAEVLIHLGDTQAAAGDPDAARDSWQQALVILNQLGEQPDAGTVRAKLHGLDQPATGPRHVRRGQQ